MCVRVGLCVVMCLVDSKLAPIFEKRNKHYETSDRKAARVLTEAEKQALEVRRAFLTSGVPEELKRQKVCVFVPDTDASSSVIWPMDSHTQQRPAAAAGTEQLLGCCDPWMLRSCDFHCRDLVTGIVDPLPPLALGSFTSVLEKAVCHKLKVCMINRDAPDNWISGSGLLDIWPLLISGSGSSSGCKLPDNEPDNLLIYY